VERTGNENKNKKNNPKGEKKSQGHRAKVERTGDKKHEKQTIRTANKNKETPMAGAAVAVKVSVGWTLLHHADLMLHSTGAAVVLEQGGRANKNKNTDDRSGSFSNSKQLALLHRADLMPHSTGAADWCEGSSIGGQDRREKKQNTRCQKGPEVKQRWRGQETRTRNKKNKPEEQQTKTKKH
jgi:hypothetical protein